MLRAKTEEQKNKVLEIFGIQETRCHFPLDFDKKTVWGYEEFDDCIYLDGNITFDKMAKIVDYLREQNNKQQGYGRNFKSIKDTAKGILAGHHP